MLHSSVNYPTIKCGCTGVECAHVYNVDKPKRSAWEEKKKNNIEDVQGR